MQVFIYSSVKEEIIKTNVFGTFNITQMFLQKDIINTKGKIISVGSDMVSFSSRKTYK